MTFAPPCFSAGELHACGIRCGNDLEHRLGPGEPKSWKGKAGSCSQPPRMRLWDLRGPCLVSLAPQVRVNCIAPGWIRTAWAAAGGRGLVQRVRETPLGPLGTPDHIAARSFSSSAPVALVHHGEVIAANGGAVRQHRSDAEFQDCRFWHRSPTFSLRARRLRTHPVCDWPPRRVLAMVSAAGAQRTCRFRLRCRRARNQRRCPDACRLGE